MAAGGMEPMDLGGTPPPPDEQDSKYGCLANFKIDKKIGKGQFSEVYRAINKIDGSVVALKKVQVTTWYHMIYLFSLYLV